MAKCGLTWLRKIIMTGSMSSFNTIALAFVLASILGACRESRGPQEDVPAGSSLTTVSDPDQGAATSQMDTSQQVAVAMQDLTKRLNVDSAMVSLSSVKTVTWRSGAKGCPQPGMNYTQALVPGVSILLLVGDTTYHYHAVTSGQPFYCPEEQVEPPVAGPGAA